MRRFVLAPLLLFAGFLGARPAHAQGVQLVAFSFTTNDSFSITSCQFGMGCLPISGSGTIPGLGSVTDAGTVVFDPQSGMKTGGSSEYGTIVFTAACGCQVTITLNGYGTTSSDYVTFNVVNGSGIFAGVGGHGVMTTQPRFTGPTTGISTDTFTGELIIPE